MHTGCSSCIYVCYCSPQISPASAAAAVQVFVLLQVSFHADNVHLQKDSQFETSTTTRTNWSALTRTKQVLKPSTRWLRFIFFSSTRPLLSNSHQFSPNPCPLDDLSFGGKFTAKLTYSTAQFGPFEVQQLWLNMSCVVVIARCRASHKTSAYKVHLSH